MDRLQYLNSSNSVQVGKNEASVIKIMCEIIAKAADEAVRERDRFIIAVSGGSAVNLLVKGLPEISTNWSKWRVVFCDERLVPADDKESTFGLYKSNLIPVTPLKEDQFISIDFSFADNPAENVRAAASDYENRLKQVFPESSLFKTGGGQVYPRLDCAILGMGPDGHTCSLFPGDVEALNAKSWVYPVINSPKPPPCRVTLTLPVLKLARACIFPITGASKASTVKSVLNDVCRDLPATLVKPSFGTVYWILDCFAASQLDVANSIPSDINGILSCK